MNKNPYPRLDSLESQVAELESELKTQDKFNSKTLDKLDSLEFKAGVTGFMAAFSFTVAVCQLIWC